MMSSMRMTSSRTWTSKECNFFQLSFILYSFFAFFTPHTPSSLTATVNNQTNKQPNSYIWEGENGRHISPQPLPSSFVDKDSSFFFGYEVIKNDDCTKICCFDLDWTLGMVRWTVRKIWTGRKREPHMHACMFWWFAWAGGWSTSAVQPDIWISSIVQ